MKRTPAENYTMPASRRIGAALVGGLLALALLVAGSDARAEGDGLSKEDQACLKCHDKEGETKTLGNGEQLSLHISTKAYVASMHKDTSCEDCHADVDGKTHGKVKSSLQSRRELALAMKDACVTCHKKKAKEYGDSVHAVMVKDGSEKGPLSCAGIQLSTPSSAAVFSAPRRSGSTPTGRRSTCRRSSPRSARSRLATRRRTAGRRR